MKITSRQLRQLIREETRRTLREFDEFTDIEDDGDLDSSPEADVSIHYDDQGMSINGGLNFLDFDVDTAVVQRMLADGFSEDEIDEAAWSDHPYVEYRDKVVREYFAKNPDIEIVDDDGELMTAQEFLALGDKT